MIKFNEELCSVSALTMAGSPAIVAVNAPSGTYANGSLLRQMNVVVRTTYKSKERTFTFNGECDNNETFIVDVGSALRSALHDRDAMSDVDTEYVDGVTYTITAFASYMIDGSIETGDSITKKDYFVKTDEDGNDVNASLCAFEGTLTEMERLALGKSFVDGMKLTTKPNGLFVYRTQEILSSNIVLDKENGKYCYRYHNEKKTITTGEAGDENIGDTITVDGIEYYVADDTMYDIFQFRFMNRRGAIEDAAAATLESKRYQVKKNQYNMYSIPSFNATPSVCSQRAIPRSSWKMSSGLVEREQAEWWAQEFLCSEKHWMRMAIGNVYKWVHVVVTPSSEDITIYDASDTGAIHIDFNVKLGLS